MPDGTPYITRNDRPVVVRNEPDGIGHRALQLLFDDLDGGECIIEPKNGILVRIDSASGHSWVTQTLIPVPLANHSDVEPLSHVLRQFALARGINPPDFDEMQEELRRFRNQSRERLRSGPDVNGTLRTIAEASFVSAEDRPLMLRTLRALATCSGLPERVAEGFLNAPDPTVRGITNDLELGLAAMCDALRTGLPAAQ